MVFSLKSPSSFQIAKELFRQIRTLAHSPKFVALVGNKCDLEPTRVNPDQPNELHTALEGFLKAQNPIPNYYRASAHYTQGNETTTGVLDEALKRLRVPPQVVEDHEQAATAFCTVHFPSFRYFKIDWPLFKSYIRSLV